MEPVYQIYQWVVLIIAGGLLLYSAWLTYTHVDYWFIFVLSGIYFLTTVVIYVLFLGIGRSWEIEAEAMMVMSAILRLQGLLTIGLCMGITSCCIRKRKWIKRQ